MGVSERAMAVLLGRLQPRRQCPEFVALSARLARGGSEDDAEMVQWHIPAPEQGRLLTSGHQNL